MTDQNTQGTQGPPAWSTPPPPAPPPPPPPTFFPRPPGRPLPPRSGRPNAGLIGLGVLVWALRRQRMVLRLGCAVVPFIVAAVLFGSAQLFHQQQQQQLWTRGAQLQAKAVRACAAVGGQMQGGYSVGASSVSLYGNCAASPSRTYTDAGVTSSCAGVSVSFNADGSLKQSDLTSAQQDYPGCFG